MIKIINMGHTVTVQQLQQLANLFPDKTIKIIDCKITVDFNAGSPAAQIQLELAQKLGSELSDSEVVYLMLPGMSLQAAMAVSFIHGLTGSLPVIITLEKSPTGTEFNIGEKVYLQAVRHEGRNFRN